LLQRKKASKQHSAELAGIRKQIAEIIRQILEDDNKGAVFYKKVSKLN